MWKQDELKPQSGPQGTVPPSATPPAPVSAPVAAPASGVAPAATTAPPVSARAAACVTQGIRIKGEITGKEDLFVDGTLEGKLDLGNASVTGGPNGKVKADISDRECVFGGNWGGK